MVTFGHISEKVTGFFAAPCDLSRYRAIIAIHELWVLSEWLRNKLKRLGPTGISRSRWTFSFEAIKMVKLLAFIDLVFLLDNNIIVEIIARTSAVSRCGSYAFLRQVCECR